MAACPHLTSLGWYQIVPFCSMQVLAYFPGMDLNIQNSLKLTLILIISAPVPGTECKILTKMKVLWEESILNHLLYKKNLLILPWPLWSFKTGRCLNDYRKEDAFSRLNCCSVSHLQTPPYSFAGKIWSM